MKKMCEEKNDSMESITLELGPFEVIFLRGMLFDILKDSDESKKNELIKAEKEAANRIMNKIFNEYDISSI